MSKAPNFESDDLDWALGELFRLAKVAGRQGMLPHEYDPELFHACYRFITSQARRDGLWMRSDLLNLMTFWLRKRRYARAA